MNKRFPILRILGTLWKVLAWIALVGGILLSLGALVVGILGSGSFLLRLLGQDTVAVPGTMGVVAGVVALLLGLVVTVIYALILYAVGDLIHLLLALEENTRHTTQLMQQAARPRAEGPSSTPPPSP